MNWAAGVSSLSIVLHIFGEPVFPAGRRRQRVLFGGVFFGFFILPDQKSHRPPSRRKMLLFGGAASAADRTNEAGSSVPERRCAGKACGFNGLRTSSTQAR